MESHDTGQPPGPLDVRELVASSLLIAIQSDLSGDRKSDIVWRHATTGQNIVWFMNGGTRTSVGTITTVDANWTVAGVGDFNGDAKADILWRKNTGEDVIWLMNGASRISAHSLTTLPDANWKVIGP